MARLPRRLAPHLGAGALALLASAAPARAAEVDIAGTWHVLVHYTDANSASPQQPRWDDRVWLLDAPDAVWKVVGQLPRPLGYGVSVSTPGGVICAGGSDPSGHYADVFRLTWRGGRLERESLPPLPRPIANMCGAIVGETLFVAGGSGDPLASPTSNLSTINTSTMTPFNIGTVEGWPELTGTGNAELWGWFPDESAPRVEQINKANGAAIKTYPLPTLAGTPAAWAFAFWGGDFWIFLMKGFETSTTVYQIDGTNGSIKGTTPASGRTIVGAGVSTCAPTIIL